MRLLKTNIKDGFELKHFPDRLRRPPYGILSHVWSKTPGYEVTFMDIQNAEKADKNRQDWRKIVQLCALAKADGLEWVWDDTFCIDKSSSAELSQAINSMYTWYSEAQVCYAYLNDVQDPAKANPLDDDSSFRRSRWFTRGWTLQELIAPKVVLLFSKNWKPLGSKTSLAGVIEEITSIDSSVLMHEHLLDDVSIARRMSWASARQTTELEDEAYCLMGIFGVNMPTIYGEGARAFIRLQQEIIRQSTDHSIFAWGVPHAYETFHVNVPSLTEDPLWAADYRCLLASSPKQFARSANLAPFLVDEFTSHTHPGISSDVPEYTPTNYGIQMHLPLYTLSGSNVGLALLACKDTTTGGLVSLLVSRVPKSANRYHIGRYSLTTGPSAAFDWHPYMRMFLVSPQSAWKGEIILQSVTLTRMYLHSHNAHPQRSRERGIASGEIVLHRALSDRAAKPRRVSFVIHGWLLRKLERIGFQLAGRGDSSSQWLGWAPRSCWKDKEGVGFSLTLSTGVPENGQRASCAAILFRCPPEDPNQAGVVFALVFGLASGGTTWATVAYRERETPVDGGKSESEISHDLVRRIVSEYATIDDHEATAKGYDFATWRKGMYKHPVSSAVKISLAPWLSGDEDLLLDKNSTIRYTVGLEVDFGGDLRLRPATQKEKVKSLSGLSVKGVR